MINMTLLFLIAPTICDIGQNITNSLEQNQIVFFQYSLPEDGMTLSLEVDEGSAILYGSNKIQTPNEALYDFLPSNSISEIFLTVDIFANRASSIRKRQAVSSTNITFYISIEGLRATNNFTLNSALGGTTTGM